MKGLGLGLIAFYIDHWQAYANAIQAVYSTERNQDLSSRRLSGLEHP